MRENPSMQRQKIPKTEGSGVYARKIILHPLSRQLWIENILARYAWINYGSDENTLYLAL